MQSLETYLTKESWKADLEETKKDFNRLYNTSYKGLTEIIKNEQGKTSLRQLFFVGGVCMTVCGISNFIGEDPKIKTGILELTLAGLNYVLAILN